MELPAGEPLDPATPPIDAVEVAASPSSSAEAELILLWRSCEKCLAIPAEPEENSFWVSLSWNDVVDGIDPIPVAPLCIFASDACLDSACELVVDEAEESLNPDVLGLVGLVGTDRLPPFSASFFFRIAFCSAALFIEGRGVSSSPNVVVDEGCSASLRLLIVGGSEPDESSGTSRTRQEKTSEPSSKIEVSGKEENAILSLSSRLMPRGG